MTGEKRMLEDLRLEPLLDPAIAWSVAVGDEVVGLHVLRPPGDSLDTHLQWVVAPPHAIGWSPGPDVILTDFERFLLVVEVKREDTSNHGTARRDALWKALGYSILFDQRRSAPQPELWVGSSKKGIPMQEALGLKPSELRRMALLPCVVGLAPVQGNGLCLAKHVTEFVTAPTLPALPRDRRWQREIADADWHSGHKKLRRWAVAERVAEGAKDVRLEPLPRDNMWHVTDGVPTSRCS